MSDDGKMQVRCTAGCNEMHPQKKSVKDTFWERGHDMIITHKIEMDLSKGGEIPRIRAVQDDKYSRNIEILLFSNGEAWPVPTDAAGIVRYLKPDGLGGSYDVLPDETPACTAAGNTLTVALAPQVCTAAGIVQLAVSLVRGQTELNTFPIQIYVQSNPQVRASSEAYYQLSGVLPCGGWKPNQYLGTDAGGNVVTKLAPEGSGSSGNGGSGFVAQSTSPADTSVLWVDTADETGNEGSFYTRTEIDAMLGSYVNDIAALVGGDA